MNMRPPAWFTASKQRSQALMVALLMRQNIGVCVADG
jgi:hypothetical protein